MKPIKTKATILSNLIARREQNIQQLLAFSDAELKELKINLCLGRDIAIQTPGFASVEIIEERIAQVHEAEDRKYSLSDDAFDWIQW